MTTSVQFSTPVHVSTNDEPTLREDFQYTSEEIYMWQSANEEEVSCLDFNKKRTLDDSAGAQPLPTHVVLKVKRNSYGYTDRFK